jgi:hypothetical protein
MTVPYINISYNSQSITFSEWVSLITLCVAPITVHLWAGMPRIALLSEPKPGWMDKLVHLNPTSIFWRYYAITARRVRSSVPLKPTELAASNTAFWVEGRKWTSSEAMMEESKAYITRRPEKGRANLFSEAGLKTIIVGIQGAQAIWDLTAGIRGDNYAILSFSLPNLFTVFAIFGLLRWPAALWLTDEADYRPTTS